MNVLVTGGCGFIGSHVVEELLARGYSVSIVGLKCHMENLADIKDKVKFIRADINDARKMLSVVKDMDGVLHLAALVNVDQSLREPEAFVRTNVMGTFNIMEAVRLNKVSKLLYMSTCEVYGNIPKGKADENHPTNPRSPYAASKFAAERYLLSYAYSFPESNVVVVRGFNQYGQRQNAGANGAVIPKFIVSLLQGRKISIFGDGEQTRDYVFVKDTARGIVSAFEKNIPSGEVINLATGVETSIADIANEIADLAGRSREWIEFVPGRPGELIRSCGDAAKAKKLLGWKPTVDFDKGLRIVFDFYKNQIA